jgi:hypothetical protein
MEWGSDPLDIVPQGSGPVLSLAKRVEEVYIYIYIYVYVYMPMS